MDHEHLNKELFDAAKELGIMLLDDFPAADSPIGKVSVSPEKFIDAIRHASPKFAYLATITFDACDEVHDQLGIESEDESSSALLKEAPVRDFLKKWKRHDGQTSLWIACFCHDAILHTCMVSPDWRDAFDEALQTLEDEVAETVEAVKHAQRAEERAVEPWLLEKAELLANHPAFNAPRVSKEKRGFLAEQLFPELQFYDRLRVVERATNIAWLRDATTES